MKNQVYVCLFTLFIAMFCFENKVKSQATSSDLFRSFSIPGTNLPSTTPGDFLGWAAGARALGATSLQIRTDDAGANATNIEFYTNNNTFRMVICGNNTATDGFVGIGVIAPEQNLSVAKGMNIDQLNAGSGSLTNALTFGHASGEGIGSNRNSGANVNGMDFYSNFLNRMSITNAGDVGIGLTNPQNLLHQHVASNNDTYHQFTNGNTGSASTDGLLVGLEYAVNFSIAGTNIPSSLGKIIQQENAAVKISTGGLFGGIIDRMIINADYGAVIHSVPVVTAGFVGIGQPNFWNVENGGEGPRSLLHMQGPYNAFTNGGAGWRSWMKTGIYMNENSDEIYVGLKNEFDINGANRSDAVIAWGDDQFDVSDGNGDCFRLIFSGGILNGNGNGNNNPISPLTPAGRRFYV